MRSQKEQTSAHGRKAHKSASTKRNFPRAFYHWEWWIVLAGFLCDFKSWNHYFVMDDLSRIVANPLLRTFQGAIHLFGNPYNAMFGMPSGLYRPFTSLTFAVNYWVNGLDPNGYHMVNRLIHVFTCLAIFWLLRRLLSSPLAAAIAALVFAVHPLQTEAVTYINGRSDSLSMMLFVLALLFFVKREDTEKRWWIYFGSLFCYFLALLSKESAITWLGVVILIEFVYFSKNEFGTFIQRIRKRFPAIYLGYGAVTLLYLAIRFAVLKEVSRVYVTVLDNPLAHVGAAVRILTALKLLLKALGLMLWPFHLAADYSYNQIPLVSHWSSPIGMAVLFLNLVLVSIALRAFKRFPNVFFAVGYFFLTYLLVSNLVVPIGTIFAERLLYQPLLGICILAGLAFEKAYLHLNSRPARRYLAGGGILILLLLMARTIIRNRDWADEFTLYAQTVRVSPQSAKAHNDLGAQYLARQDPGAALKEFETAKAIKPDYPDLLNNLGTLYYQKNELEKAVAEFHRAISLAPENPEIRNNLGLALRAQGKFDEAIAEYDELLRRYPQNADAHFNKGNSLYAAGRTQEAVQEYMQTLEIDPGYTLARRNIQAIVQDKQSR